MRRVAFTFIHMYVHLSWFIVVTAFHGIQPKTFSFYSKLQNLKNFFNRKVWDRLQRNYFSKVKMRNLIKVSIKIYNSNRFSWKGNFFAPRFWVLKFHIFSKHVWNAQALFCFYFKTFFWRGGNLFRRELHIMFFQANHCGGRVRTQLFWPWVHVRKLELSNEFLHRQCFLL